MSKVFKLKGGEKEYEEYFHAITVAEAKAEQAGEPVEVCRKEVDAFTPVVRILPDGSQEKLD